MDLWFTKIKETLMDGNIILVYDSQPIQFRIFEPG